MPLDKVLSSSIANGAVTAALISNTANLVVSSLTANVITITTISGSANVTGDMTVGGNLTISGTTTYVNTTDLNIGDAIISLNADLAANVAPTENAGLNINRGASTNAQFVWVESTDNWSLGNTSIGGTLATTSNTVTLGTAAYFVANGNVGVGTASPVAKLQIVSDNPFRLNNAASSSQADLYFADSGATLKVENFFGTGSAITFGTNANGAGVTEKARIDSSGNLGVGTTGQVSRISASGNSATDFKALTLRNSNGTANSSAVLNFESSAGAEGDAASSAAQIKGVREGAGTNGALAFWTSLSGTSAERARIDSSGNLIVGGTTALNTSSGRGNITLNGANGAILQFSVGGADKGWIFHDSTNLAMQNTTGSGSLIFNTNNTERARIDSSGNLRVGTTSSLSVADKLTVVGGNFAVQRTSGITTFMGDNTVDGYAGTATNHAFALLTNSIERARIDTSGNLGVGVTSIATPSASRRAMQISNSTSGGIIYLGSAGTEGDNARIFSTISTQYDLGLVAGGSTGFINFYTNGQERARIKSNGYMGIGTDSPVLRLHVSDSNGSGSMQLGSNAASQYQYFNFGGEAGGQNAWQIGKADAGGAIAPSQGFYLYDLKNSTTRMVVNTSGYVGIGTTSPSYILDVNGMARVTGFQNNSLYSYNMIGTYTGSTWYAITDGGTMAQPGVYICVMYVDSYNIGGAVYYYTFASVPFYWTGNTVGSNGTYAQVLPTMYGTGHALNSQTPPSLRIIERTSGLTPQLQFSLPFTLTYSGTSGSQLIFNFTKIA